MILAVDPDAGTAELLDVEVLSRFHVAVHGRSENDLDGVDSAVVSAGAGRLSGHEILVPIEWVRQQGRRSGPADWEKDLDAMVEFSASRGWVEDGAAVGGSAAVPSLRVHCEWPSEPKFAALDFTRTALREDRVHVGVERYVAPDVVMHTGISRPDVVGPEAVIVALAAGGPPASRLEVKHVLADGEMVAVHTQRAAPSASRSVELFQVRGGLITEWWRVVDGPADGTA